MGPVDGGGGGAPLRMPHAGGEHGASGPSYAPSMAPNGLHLPTIAGASSTAPAGVSRHHAPVLKPRALQPGKKLHSFIPLDVERVEGRRRQMWDYGTRSMVQRRPSFAGSMQDGYEGRVVPRSFDGGAK